MEAGTLGRRLSQAFGLAVVSESDQVVVEKVIRSGQIKWLYFNYRANSACECIHTHIPKGLVVQYFLDYLEYPRVHLINSLFVTCSRMGLSFLPPFNPISRVAFCMIENREGNFIYKVIQHLYIEDKISISKEKVGLSCRCSFPKLGDSGFPFD